MFAGVRSVCFAFLVASWVTRRAVCFLPSIWSRVWQCSFMRYRQREPPGLESAGSMRTPGGYRSRETDPYTIMLTEMDRFTWPCRVSAMLRFVDSPCQLDASSMPYQLFDDTHVGLPLFLYYYFVPCVLSASPMIVSCCMFCESEKCCLSRYIIHFAPFHCLDWVFTGRLRSPDRGSSMPWVLTGVLTGVPTGMHR